MKKFLQVLSILCLSNIGQAQYTINSNTDTLLQQYLAQVEIAPRFPSPICECEKDTSWDERNKKQCADKAMLQFIYSNFRIPQKDCEMGVHGTLVIGFVVKTDGSIEDITILKAPSETLAAEGVRIVELMRDTLPKWTAGKKGKKNKDMNYKLPIRYKPNC